MDLDQLERLAREMLPGNVYDFFSSGADDELTLAENVEAWTRLRLRPRVLRDVSTVCTRTTVLGREVSMPIMVAPTAFHRLAHPDGELATARAAAAAGTLMVVSTRASVPLADIAATAPDAPRWFQLYILRDRAWTAELVDLATAAGYDAIVLTVDAPVVGRRRCEETSPLVLPDGVHMANIGSAVACELDDVLSYPGFQHDSHLTFDDLTWLRSICELPVVVKGVLRGDDAAACVDAGVAGIVVSNHGGRQLDSAVATADALAEVVDAVGGRVEVFVDGGIRRGTDVLKALALGARAVLIGRPVLWGLVTGGTDGVATVLNGFRDELARALALCSAPSIADVSPDLLATGRGAG